MLAEASTSYKTAASTLAEGGTYHRPSWETAMEEQTARRAATAATAAAA